MKKNLILTQNKNNKMMTTIVNKIKKPHNKTTNKIAIKMKISKVTIMMTRMRMTRISLDQIRTQMTVTKNRSNNSQMMTIKKNSQLLKCPPKNNPNSLSLHLFSAKYPVFHLQLRILLVPYIHLLQQAIEDPTTITMSPSN